MDTRDSCLRKLELAVHSYAKRCSLSSQEHKLLTCAVRGVSDKVAAAELGCSRNTVGTYWQRICRKTGCHPQREVFADLLRFVLSTADVAEFLRPSVLFAERTENK